MPDASPDRPARHTILRTIVGHINADPDAVFAAIAKRLKPLHHEAEHVHFSVDAGQRLVVSQGGWWYRGEWRVTPADNGSQVEHLLLNVAQRAHWAGPITGRSVIAGAPASFKALLADVSEELAAG